MSVYNISTGSLVKVRKNSELSFKSEIALSVMIAWKQYKKEKKRESKRNSHSGIGLDNQQSQSVINVVNSETENRTENISNPNPS